MYMSGYADYTNINKYQQYDIPLIIANEETISKYANIVYSYHDEEIGEVSSPEIQGGYPISDHYSYKAFFHVKSNTIGQTINTGNYTDMSMPIPGITDVDARFYDGTSATGLTIFGGKYQLFGNCLGSTLREDGVIASVNVQSPRAG